ncbi:MAG TPA: response regulator [Patescibacteria group bacterium]
MNENNPKKILVAEDDELYGKVYLNKLTKEGYQVFLVLNGKEAIEVAKRERPDLILMDIIMPVMDGFTALKEIKSDPATQNLRVLIMSNLSQDADISKAKEMGAEDYFVKSNISISEFIEKINSMLR